MEAERMGVQPVEEFSAYAVIESPAEADEFVGQLVLKYGPDTMRGAAQGDSQALLAAQCSLTRFRSTAMDFRSSSPGLVGSGPATGPKADLMGSIIDASSATIGGRR